MAEKMSQASNFALDIQEKMQKGLSLVDATREALDGYPGAEVGHDVEFPDGSKASLFEEKGKHYWEVG